jgi:ParB/RepB/Spo0J family partition protein
MDKKNLMKNSLYGNVTLPATAVAEPTDDEEKIVWLNLDEINDFHAHTFNVVHDEKMDGLIESYKRNPKLIEPVIVRRDIRYGNPHECIIGHRRRYAARKAECTQIQGIIRKMTDAEANLCMIDSNFNSRPYFTLREICGSLKLKYETLKEMAVYGDGRTDKALANELESSMKMSRATLQRYIVLLKLNDPLFDLVEKRKLTKQIGEIFAGLKKESQKTLAAYFDDAGKIPKITKEMAEGVRVLEKANGLSFASLNTMFEVGVEKPEKFKLSEKDIKDIFPEGYTGNIAEKKQLILTLLENYFNSSQIETN